MRYVLQLEQSRDTRFTRLSCFRHQTEPNGIMTSRYLGGTAVLTSNTKYYNPSELLMLDNFAWQGGQTDQTHETQGFGLDALAQIGVQAWNQILLTSTQPPLRARTVLAENRTPKEQVLPIGAPIPAIRALQNHEPRTEGNLFIGYVAIPPEIEALERIDGHVQALIVASEGPMPGNYL